MREVNIKTKLIFFYDDQYLLFCVLSFVAMNFHFNGNREKANLPSLLIHLMNKRGVKPFDDIKFREPLGKHKKTTLLYFSEQQHLVFTKYIEKTIPKGLSAKTKKLAFTQVIIKLLTNYLLDSVGQQAVLKIYNKVIKRKNERTK